MTGRSPWVKYWVHNGFVNVNKQKMSKSLGNFFTLKDISLLFPNISYDNLKERMSYFSKTGAIKKLRRGIYVKDNFDVLVYLCFEKQERR